MAEHTDSGYIGNSLFPGTDNPARGSEQDGVIKFSGEDLKKLAREIALRQEKEPEQPRSDKKWKRRR